MAHLIWLCDLSHGLLLQEKSLEEVFKKFQGEAQVRGVRVLVQTSVGFGAQSLV